MGDFSLSSVFQKYYPEHKQGYVDLNGNGIREPKEEILDFNKNSKVDDFELWYFLGKQAAKIRKEIFLEMRKRGVKKAIDQMSSHLLVIRPETEGIIDRLVKIAENDLIEMLKTVTEGKTVHQQIIAALGKKKSQQAAPVLLEIAFRIRFSWIGPGKELLETIAKALAQINHPSTLKELDRRAAFPSSADISELTAIEVRKTAIFILSYLPGEKPEKILIGRLSSEKDDFVKAKVIEALGRLKTTEAAPRILGLIYDKSDFIKGAVAKALGDLQYTPAENKLIALFKKTKDESVKKDAIHALGKIKSKKAIGLLINSLAVMSLYNVSIEALKNIGRAAIPKLIRALDNKNSDIRLGVVMTLSKFTRNKKVGKALWRRLAKEKNGEVKGEIQYLFDNSYFLPPRKGR